MKSRLEQLLDELLRQIDIPAMEQAMSKQYKSQIRRRWELPADYWMLLERCCGLRTVWSNDTYEALELWGLDTLVKGQEGYAYNPVEQKVIKDWDEHLVVIASDAGDPYCLDLRRNDTAVFWAEHGAGTWDFQPAFDCLEDFLESVLDVPKTQEYYRAAEWMKDSEKNATGCATWYYRYSVALMYCGRLEEALEYAERGALEEPDYPWIWLHLGKLRAHFGDKSGALDAVKQGLKLEPGDYEFLTLKKEIKAGATLEQMEYHWINPDADQTLQRGLDENADDKQCAIACIRVDEAGLAEFYELFHPERYSYKKNSPCCEFQYPVKEHLVELSFRMNEAGLSKMGTDWLRQLKERLDSGEWLTHTPEGEPEGILTGVFVDQTRRIGLVYQQPGDDQYFQIFLNPDGTKADAFWSSRKNSEPEVYSEDEMSAIEQHIKNTFGEFENVFHELVSPDIHVDICVVPPSDERDYYTLVCLCRCDWQSH